MVLKWYLNGLEMIGAWAENKGRIIFPGRRWWRRWRCWHLGTTRPAHLATDGAVLDSVLDALRASLDVLCKMSTICELHPFHLNSSDITFRHHTHHIHHIHRIDFQYINGLTRSHLSRPQDVSGLGLVQTRPGRPGRAELVTTAAFRLKDLWAVASRSPR